MSLAVDVVVVLFKCVYAACRSLYCMFNLKHVHHRMLVIFMQYVRMRNWILSVTIVVHVHVLLI